MPKRTHKLSALGDVAAIIANAASMTAAAKQLGVDRSTIHRWVVAGKVPAPGAKRGDVDTPEVVPLSQTPDQWAAAIRAEHTLGRTDLQLLDLAVVALTQARDVAAAPRDRMSAIARFQMVVRQLNLPEVPAAKPETSGREARPARPAVMREDPRSAFLRAVK